MLWVLQALLSAKGALGAWLCTSSVRSQALTSPDIQQLLQTAHSFLPFPAPHLHFKESAAAGCC